MLLPKHTRRIFVAVNVPIETYSLLDNLKENHPQPSSFKWMRPQNLHITIYFIGNIISENFNQVTEEIKIIAATTAPFNLEFDALTLMPSAQPTMLWARYRPQKAFSNMYHKLNRVIQPITGSRLTIYETPFPHITLARFHGMKEFSNKLPLDFQLPNLPVNTIHIWETESKEGQSDYIPLPYNLLLSGK